MEQSLPGICSFRASVNMISLGPRYSLQVRPPAYLQRTVDLALGQKVSIYLEWSNLHLENTTYP